LDRFAARCTVPVHRFTRLRSLRIRLLPSAPLQFFTTDRSLDRSRLVCDAFCTTFTCITTYLWIYTFTVCGFCTFSFVPVTFLVRSLRSFVVATPPLRTFQILVPRSVHSCLMFCDRCRCVAVTHCVAVATILHDLRVVTALRYAFAVRYVTILLFVACALHPRSRYVPLFALLPLFCVTLPLPFLPRLPLPRLRCVLPAFVELLLPITVAVCRCLPIVVRYVADRYVPLPLCHHRCVGYVLYLPRCVVRSPPLWVTVLYTHAPPPTYLPRFTVPVGLLPLYRCSVLRILPVSAIPARSAVDRFTHLPHGCTLRLF